MLLYYSLYLLLTYLVGAIPTGYLVAKKVMGIDIRDHGSGNTGATNVKRVVGNKAGLFVLFCDFLKGFIPVFVAIRLFPDAPFFQIIVALMAMVGHSRSIFLGFTGGKSAITGLGCMLGLQPLAGLCIGLVALLIFKITRYVSLASLTAAVSAPIIMYGVHAPFAHIVFALMGALLVFYLHRSNIGRLIQGTENRL